MIQKRGDRVTEKSLIRPEQRGQGRAEGLALDQRTHCLPPKEKGRRSVWFQRCPVRWVHAMFGACGDPSLTPLVFSVKAEAAENLERRRGIGDGREENQAVF